MQKNVENPKKKYEVQKVHSCSFWKKKWFFFVISIKYSNAIIIAIIFLEVYFFQGSLFFSGKFIFFLSSLFFSWKFSENFWKFFYVFFERNFFSQLCLSNGFFWNITLIFIPSSKCWFLFVIFIFHGNLYLLFFQFSFF